MRIRRMFALGVLAFVFCGAVAEAGGTAISYQGSEIKDTRSIGERHLGKGTVTILHHNQNVSRYANYSDHGMKVTLLKTVFWGAVPQYSRVFYGTVSNGTHTHVIGESGEYFLRFEVLDRYAAYDIRGYLEIADYTAMRSAVIEDGMDANTLQYDRVYDERIR